MGGTHTKTRSKELEKWKDDPRKLLERATPHKRGEYFKKSPVSLTNNEKRMCCTPITGTKNVSHSSSPSLLTRISPNPHAEMSNAMNHTGQGALAMETSFPHKNKRCGPAEMVNESDSGSGKRKHHKTKSRAKPSDVTDEMINGEENLQVRPTEPRRRSEVEATAPTNSQGTSRVDDNYRGDVGHTWQSSTHRERSKSSAGPTSGQEEFYSPQSSNPQTAEKTRATDVRHNAAEPTEDLPTGDTRKVNQPRRSHDHHKNHTRQPSGQCLTNKPPTPPSKPSGVRSSSTTTPPAMPTRMQPCRKHSAPPVRYSKSIRAPTPGADYSQTPMRSNSLPRPATADHWSRGPVGTPSPQMYPKPRRTASVSQHSEGDPYSDRLQCLSRIEYTFYISDTEAYQRPFFDRRVEAIARACQCTICLHKPPPGHRSIFYKGMRVLPVTISARTMVSLKRCLARLDMQYPYFNVKAFCPPDMY